ncbi:MAG: DVUA0089 family protein [Rhodocyclaceae bacterium]
MSTAKALRRWLAVLMAVGTIGGAHATIIINDHIDQYYSWTTLPSGRSVDFFNIRSTGGAASFALESKTAFFDTALWLFRKDGALDYTDLIASDDGGTWSWNALLNVTLAPGLYILAVGSDWLSTPLDGAKDIVNGLQFENGLDRTWSTPLSYQLTLSGAVTTNLAAAINAVPEPASLALVLGALGLAGVVARRRRR